MPPARVILDFPGTGRNSERLEFGPPHRVISAHRVENVRPALREAEQAAARGAWVAGLVAYEAAPAFDPALVTRAHAGAVPLVWFGVFDPPVSTCAPAGAIRLPPLVWTVDASREVYGDAIAIIRELIAAGDVYQVNHTLRFHASCTVAPRELYDALVAVRHGRYHALIETPDWAVVSASPELFIDIRDDMITTRPMKGTARRGRWSAEDDEIAARLTRSEKDRAENLMIVDLLRNDFGRIARFGTVTVEDMFALETYPSVHQLTSTITARMRDDVSLVDVFAAAFPCGSVTGAPRIAAMKQIAALESSPRGAYCGAIGVIRPDGTATFNVAIRTLVIDRRTASAVYGAGGGITWDSSATAEYDEAVAKAGLLLESTPPFDLLETLRLEHGTLHRLDLHLQRLARSARYFGFSADVQHAAAAALRRVVADHADGVWRVRMTVSRDAHVSLACVLLDTESGYLTPDGHGPVARHPDVHESRSQEPAQPLPLVALATKPVHSHDRMLFHKTTARTVYDDARADHPEAFDVLLRNEHDCITEFTIGNVVCEIDGRLVTPPLSDGLLPGTFRQQLLQTSAVREERIPVADLPRVSRMWLVNSLRGCVPVRLA